ncbi:MAG: 23S rRNA (guanosine(2251)-2'-O)-methyltransferase RlmB [Lachnospiraceae bacterium]|nr:23S rRNA (guanosine(2251)-2'-O)-methyltransferase RlmB [Lachnospiraceae bacterium]
MADRVEYNDEVNLKIEGRHEVLEAFRSGRSIDRLYVQENVNDGPIRNIVKVARQAGCIINFVSKEKLNEMSESHRHQGVIALAAAFQYASLDDILKKAEEKEEPPFIILLDGIEDPHNLGAIIRTADIAGAHGVVIPKRRASGLTATVMRTSAGALNYVPVARVTNMKAAMEELKAKGLWFVCADMDGDTMYDLNLTGPIGLVVGNEGSGVSRLVREECDFVASVPMFGEINSLNASVAAGVLMYEIVRQRVKK